MNHYCTYFDSGFLPQGRALWASLRAHDPDAVLWILALDDAVAVSFEPDARLRIVSLATLETEDPALAAVKGHRTRVEYYFTLSPCWPRWLLRTQAVIDRLVYLDADLMFFSAPDPIWTELAAGSILLCRHRFPDWLRHLERHGRFNVGVLGWKRDEAGFACLEDWRARCLEWCYDRLEPGRYADQKYLDDWPDRFPGVVVCTHPGVNLAPWNWMTARVDSGTLEVDGSPLVVFHFASLRRLGGGWWDSGQLDYAVMPGRLRQRIYGAYLDLLERAVPAAARQARPIHGPRRLGRAAVRFLLGALWHRRSDGTLVAWGLPFAGRFSGRMLALIQGENAKGPT